MNKNVIISVRGTQAAANHETSEMELVTEGKYYKKGNAYYVTYKESEVFKDKTLYNKKNSILTNYWEVSGLTSTDEEQKIIAEIEFKE